MKKNIILSLLAAAVLVSTPAVLSAQEAEQTGQGCPARVARCERPAHPVPCLSAEQRAQMKALRAEHHDAVAPLRESLMRKKMELHALAPNPNVKPEELKALVAEICELRKKIHVLNGEHRAKLEKAGLPSPRFHDGDGPRGPRHGFHKENSPCGPRHGFHGSCPR